MEPGALISNRYEVIQTLGDGRVGVVYKVNDTLLDDTVALRIISDGILSSPDAVKKFKEEIKTVRKLNHRNIARVIDIGITAENLLFYTMEFVEGESLRQSLTRNGLFQWKRGLEIIKQLCSGIAHAHKNRIFHLNIKPENIILTNSGDVKIIDFGIVPALRPTADGKADIHSAGTVACEILTNVPPSELSDEISAINPSVPRSVNAVIMRAIGQDLSERYNSIVEFLDHLVSGADTSDSNPAIEDLKSRAEAAYAAGNTNRAAGLFEQAANLALDLYTAEKDENLKKKYKELGEACAKRALAIKKEIEEMPNVGNEQNMIKCPSCGSATPSNLANCEWCNKPLSAGGTASGGGETDWDDGGTKCQKCGRPASSGKTVCDACAGDSERVNVTPTTYTKGSIPEFWREIRSMEEHTDVVRGVGFTPDGRTLISAGYDKTIKMYEVSSGRTLNTIKGHNDSICSLAISPDGATLATGAYKSIKFWNISSGRELRELPFAQEWVVSLAYSPDGRLIGSCEVCVQATCSHGAHAVKITDATSGNTVAQLAGHKDNVWAIAFSPDSRTCATGSYDGTIKIWDVASGREMRTITGYMGGVCSVAFSPDGSLLASGNGAQTVSLWDWRKGEELYTFTGNLNYLRTVAFSKDGNALVSGGADQTVKLYSVPDRDLLNTFCGHKGNIWQVCFSPDGKMIASCSEDKKVKLWVPK